MMRIAFMRLAVVTLGGIAAYMIDQWYSLQGRPGVVFILNVTDPAMAKEMLEALPLGRVSFELVPLGPLTPLRQLLPAHPQ